MQESWIHLRWPGIWDRMLLRQLNPANGQADTGLAVQHALFRYTHIDICCS